MRPFLRYPALEDKENYLDYLNAWEDEDQIIPYSSRLLGRSYEQFIKELPLRELGLINPEKLVPEIIHILVDEKHTIFGVLSFRLKLNDHLLAYDGHIGYGISPSKRGKGYGKLILKLAISLAKERGFKKVLVTCNEENKRSEAVILSQGGILENKVYKTDGFIHRYWIYIK